MSRRPPHPCSPRSNRPARARRPLTVEGLEDRTVLSASRTLGGLEFVTAGQFNTQHTPAGDVIRTTSPVDVGVAPVAGGEFVPLVRFAGGVSFLDGDPAGKFTGRGGVTGTIGGANIPLAAPAARELSAQTLLNGGLGLAGGKTLSVAGAQFTLSGIDLDADAVKLQGRIGLPQVAGLQVAVEGDDYVVIDRSRVHLTGLDASVSGLSFRRGGAGFNLGELHVHYSAADHSFAITGDGTVTVAGREIGIELGGEETAGLVIADGKFQSLDMAVTGGFNVGGLTFTADHLRFAYSVPDNTFRMTGTAGAAFGTTQMSVTFADDGGLVVQNGKLFHLDAAIDGQFTVAGLTVQAENLGLTYDAGHARYGVFGGAFVSAGGVLDHVGVTFGDGARDPGLVIWKGKVQELDVAVDGTVSVGGLSLASDGLRLRYDVRAGEIQVLGGLRLEVGPSLTAAAKLTGDGMTIDAATGRVDVTGLRFEADADFGAVRVHDLVVEYQNAPARAAWLAQGSVQLAPGVEVGGAFEIVDGKITRVALNYDAGSGLGIPIGQTGLYLTHVGGEITNLDSPADIDVALDAQVTYGRRVRFMGTEYAVFQANGTLEVTKDEVKLTGGIQLVNGYLGSGTATVDLNWAEKRFTVAYDTLMYSGTFHQQGTLTLDGTGVITLDAKAVLQAPEAIKSELKSFGLPTEVAEADFRLRIDVSKPGGENYAEASASAGPFTATVRYDFDNKLTLGVFNGALQKLTKAITAAGKAVTETFDAAGRLARRVTEEAGKKVTETINAAGVVTQRVTAAAGKTVTETFDAAGKLTQRLTDTAGKTVSETFDAAGRVATRVTYEAGRKVTETLNSAGRVTKRVTEEAGRKVTETLDLLGNVSQRVTEEAGKVVTTTFALGHRLTEKVEQFAIYSVGGIPMRLRQIVTGTFSWSGSLTRKVTEGLDTAGRVFHRVTETTGKTVTETLNTAGTVIRRVTEQAGERIIETFDAAGNRLRRVVEDIGDALNPMNWF